jgi:hypothetical protein
VHELMAARRAGGSVRPPSRGATADAEALARARAQVDSARRVLGEHGPVWWTDGAPDYYRRLVKGTPYTEWFASLEGRAWRVIGR